MRSFQLRIVVGLLTFLLFGVARGAEYFYFDPTNLAAKQIVISPISFGGHQSVPASMCSSHEEFMCYRSAPLTLAIPKKVGAMDVWRHDGFEYKVVQRVRASVLGTEATLIQILQRDEKGGEFVFLYSDIQGLIALRSVQSNGPTFMLENKCGLLAPATCKEP